MLRSDYIFIVENKTNVQKNTNAKAYSNADMFYHNVLIYDLNQKTKCIFNVHFVLDSDRSREAISLLVSLACMFSSANTFLVSKNASGFFHGLPQKLLIFARQYFNQTNFLDSQQFFYTLKKPRQQTTIFLGNGFFFLGDLGHKGKIQNYYIK